jgi:hypothetical protein
MTDWTRLFPSTSSSRPWAARWNCPPPKIDLNKMRENPDGIFTVLNISKVNIVVRRDVRLAVGRLFPK